MPDVTPTMFSKSGPQQMQCVSIAAGQQKVLVGAFLVLECNVAHGSRCLALQFDSWILWLVVHPTMHLNKSDSTDFVAGHDSYAVVAAFSPSSPCWLEYGKLGDEVCTTFSLISD